MGQESLKIREKQKNIGGIQRNALVRMTRAYRTASWNARCVVGGSPPIHLVIEERDRIYEEGQPTLQKARTMAPWQEEWNSNREKGQWTKRLIPSLVPWVERKFGELQSLQTYTKKGGGVLVSRNLREGISHTSERLAEYL